MICVLFKLKKFSLSLPPPLVEHNIIHNIIVIFIYFYTAISLFIHLRDKKCNLEQYNYKTIQVNEAIMQNTSDPPLSTYYLIQRNLSLGFSPLICPPHSSRGTECSLKPSTFHYTHANIILIYSPINTTLRNTSRWSLSQPSRSP